MRLQRSICGTIREECFIFPLQMFLTEIWFRFIMKKIVRNLSVSMESSKFFVRIG